MKPQKPIVLIVDDTLANLALLSQFLETSGNYRVLGAECGVRAIEQVRRLKPDIILLDVLMPGLDGFETCRLLKANPATREIPIIFLTALTDTVDKVRGFELGGVDYITKPVQEAEVLARLNTHLTIVTLQQQLEKHNQTLEEQVASRTQALALANQELLSANQELAMSNQKLGHANQQLVNVNRTLEAEITRRKRSEEEKDHLLTTIRQQTDQLSHLTNLLIDAHQAQRRGLALELREQVEKNLKLVTSRLDLIGQLLTNQGNTKKLIQCHLNNSRQVLEQTQRYLQSVDLDSETPEEKQLRESPLLTLTTREREVLQLIGEGKSIAHIADVLNIAQKTVYTYRNRLVKKLQLNDTNELIIFAATHKLSEKP